MQLDKKLLFVAIVLVLLIMVVSFNFEKFTGQATIPKATKVYVSADPNVKSQSNPKIMHGSKVYFTIETGSEGSDRDFMIYDSNTEREMRRASVEIKEECGGDTCRPNRQTKTEYRTENDWEGRYCGKVLDLYLNKEAGACFTII